MSSDENTQTASKQDFENWTRFDTYVGGRRCVPQRKSATAARPWSQVSIQEMIASLRAELQDIEHAIQALEEIAGERLIPERKQRTRSRE
ncbi:MAG: hypothetical protein LAO55_02960 [Acidobacteriia bacterium]|nr:hypothetical protein [Terriglobia bacterium]